MSKGRVLITGGATGIGFGIAELLGALGAHVVIASRKQEHLDTAAAALEKSGSRVTTTIAFGAKSAATLSHSWSPR